VEGRDHRDQRDRDRQRDGDREPARQDRQRLVLVDVAAGLVDVRAVSGRLDRAELTVASTPSNLFSDFSIRAAQEAQPIPSRSRRSSRVSTAMLLIIPLWGMAASG
jgi:hypothetical protein